MFLCPFGLYCSACFGILFVFDTYNSIRRHWFLSHELQALMTVMIQNTRCLLLQIFCVPEQGSLTIVRRSSTKKNQNHSGTVAGCPSSSSFTDDEALDAVDLDTDNLPAVDTPDACDKAAIRSVPLDTICVCSLLFSMVLQPP
jgi:hypothetical protein